MRRLLAALLPWICGAIWLAAPLAVQAQAGASRSAQKSLRKARQAYAARHWPQAEKHIQMALRKAPDYTDAYVAYAAWLASANRHQDGILLLQTGMAKAPGADSMLTIPLAQALLAAGRPADVMRLRPPRQGNAVWEQAVSRARWMQQESAGPAIRADSVQRLATWRINTAGDELSPRLSPDGRRLLFSRRLPGGDEEIVEAAYDDTCREWMGAHRLPYPINTAQPDCGPMVSADRHYLFFSRCDMRALNGWEGGGCDLFMAYTADTAWSVPQSFGGTINSPAYEGAPCLSADNRTLYFASDRPGGYGGMDLWCAHFENSRWQMPVNLGPAVNTAGNESFPFLHPDGQSLYFCSDGLPGYGGQDVFLAVNAGNDSLWQKPLNAGVGINSPANDAAPFVDASGRYILFSTDRDRVAGQHDIFQAVLPKALRPGGVAFVTGHSHDSLSGERINYARIAFVDKSTGREMASVQTNRGDGSYCLALPAGRAFVRKVSRIAYQDVTDVLSTPTYAAWPPDTANVAMLPYDYIAPTYDSLVLVLHFERNAVQLSDSASGQLAQMLTWKNKPGMVILVNSYTDNTGTPMLNESISAQRAQNVAGTLQRLGFRMDALQSQGFGEAQPVADNETEAGRAMNRRVELVIRR